MIPTGDTLSLPDLARRFALYQKVEEFGGEYGLAGDPQQRVRELSDAMPDAWATIVREVGYWDYTHLVWVDPGDARGFYALVG